LPGGCAKHSPNPVGSRKRGCSGLALQSGMFSVRSAYHCQWSSQFDDETNTSNRNVWKGLWKLAVPGKIKIFGWRVLKGFVPCKGILFNRHIADDADCPMCQSRMEDLKHMMFLCDRARTIWDQLGVWRHIQELSSGDRSG